MRARACLCTSNVLDMKGMENKCRYVKRRGFDDGAIRPIPFINGG